MAKYSTGFRQQLINNKGFKDIFSNGMLYFFDGAPPNNADDAYNSNGSIYIGSVSALQFDNPSDAVLQAYGYWTIVGLWPGVASWARLSQPGDTAIDSTSYARIDLSVGVSNAEIILKNTAFSIGMVQSLTYTNFTIKNLNN